MAEAIAVQQVTDEENDLVIPDVSNLVTEDDTPVDSIFSERQMDLLKECLYTGWAGPGDGRSYIAMSNVAFYFALRQPPLVPDVLVSLDVQAPEDVWMKEHHSYFLWEYGKPPDVVVEIVSNRVGGELTNKLVEYARLGVVYYVVYDPYHHLGPQALRIFARQAPGFGELADAWLPGMGLGFVVWDGEYQGIRAPYLRWRDGNGHLLISAEETAELARQQSADAQAAVEQERARTEQQRARADQLAAKLRSLGVDPDQ
jgi:Uma2 family endonuclease